MRTFITLLVLLAAAGPAVAQNSTSPAPLRLHGTIVSVTTSAIVLRTAGGTQTVALRPATKVRGETASSLAAITARSYIGTTVMPQPDGSLRSIEVHIFSPDMKGTGEGYHPMANQPHAMMANATVAHIAAVPQRMMANATVKVVGASSGATKVVLVYRGGTKSVTIPADTPVVAFQPGSRALLVPGARVSVAAVPGKDGLTATQVAVGEHGLVPR
jgi:hypothetical protein